MSTVVCFDFFIIEKSLLRKRDVIKIGSFLCVSLCSPYARDNYWLKVCLSVSLLFFFSLIILVYQYPSNQALLQQKATPQDNPQLSVIRKFDEIYQQQHRYQTEQAFVHYKQQNHSFRITNTYARENFLRSQETNSFRIPQGDCHESHDEIDTSHIFLFLIISCLSFVIAVAFVVFVDDGWREVEIFHSLRLFFEIIHHFSCLLKPSS